MARFAARGLLLLALLLPAAARAQADDPYAAFGAHDYEAMRAAIETLSTSGDARAPAVLSALQSGQLRVGEDGTLYLRAADGTLREALSGAVATGVDGAALKEVRMNNAVRRALDGALGGLRLFAGDPATRAAAAEAVFKGRDQAALPALERAIAKETDAGVKSVMAQAHAALILTGGTASESDKLAAIAVLRARGDLEASSLLASLTGQPVAVMSAARDALTAIQRQRQLWDIAESVFYGLSLGSVLLLAAAGLAITFGVMGVINMAHGEMVMLGAYTTFVVQETMRAHAPGLIGASLFVAVPAAFLVAGAVGIVIERGLIRFLYGRPLETLLATWGLSLILQQVVRSIFGPSNRDVSTPAWMSGAFPLGGLTITANRLTIIVFAALVFTVLMLALRRTALGLRMRAVTQNRFMAAAMGIRTPWIDALTFGLGSGVAGIAGVALSQIDNVSPNLGQSYIIDSFMVVVFGGVGNLWGTALGALTLGIVNKFLEPLAGAVLGKIAVLVLLIIFIQRRPRGMFPLKGRAVEA